MNKYRSLNIYEGVQVTKDNIFDVAEELGFEVKEMPVSNHWLLQGDFSIMGRFDQYIFRNPNGDLRLVDDEDFDKRYEEVDDGEH